MAFELSKAQKAVVDHRNGSLLVAAAAGSGKTAVLVRRIIEKIKGEEDFALSRMLIVTFTNAAAAEMRERIGQAILEELEAEPENERFLKAAAEVPLAEMCTIDSFCNRVVKDNFNVLGLDPGFVIGDDSELELLSQDLLTEIFEEEYTSSKEDFMSLMKVYGKFKDDGSVKKLVERTRSYADSLAEPIKWLDKAEANVASATFDGAIFEQIRLGVEKKLNRALELNSQAMDICRSGQGLEVCMPVLVSDRDQIEDLKRNLSSFEEAYSAFGSVSWEAWSRASKNLDVDKKNLAKMVRDKSKNLVDGIKSKYFFESPQDLKLGAERMRPALLGLIRVTRNYMNRLLLEKHELSKYSFSDIEHFAYEILCTDDGQGDILPTEIAKEMSKNYDEIMIDEYQDSTILQEFILSSVSGEKNGVPNLFMVGDVKQSIYSFRRARPELFNRKYRDFDRVTVGCEPPKSTHVLIDLNTNYRSRKAVLDSVNVLMAGLMTAEETGIEYDDNAALHFGRTDFTPDTEQNNTEVILIDKDIDTEIESNDKVSSDDTDIAVDSEPDEKLTAGSMDEMQREAFIIGERILRLVREDNYSFKDICILTRAKKNVTDCFSEVLGSMGIPAHGEKGSGYFAAVEVDKILSFLRILDNPYQDLYFVSVLYSPIGNITTEELADIKIYNKLQEEKLAEEERLAIEEAVNGEDREIKKHKQKSFYDMCRAYADKNEKLQEFFVLFDEIRELSQYMTVHEILEEIYRRTNYPDIVSIQPKGDRRRANLERLVTYAKDYERSSYTGIGDFVRYVDKLISNEKDMGEAEVGIEENAVSLMTIHKSKGLEYPVVFLAQASHGFNDMDFNEPVLFSEELGIVSNVINIEKRTKRNALMRSVVLVSGKQESRAEETRMLYVALTRAKNKLIIVGTVENLLDEKKYKEKLMKLELDSCKSYMDMLLNKFLKAVGDRTESFAAGQMVSGIINGICESEDGGVGYSAVFDMKYVSALPAVVPYNAQQEVDNNAGEQAIINPLDNEFIAGEIAKRKNYQYAYANIAQAPVKVSVSELKHKAMELELDVDSELSEGVKVHLAAGQDTLATVRGTLYHETLEKLKYKYDYSDSEKAFDSIQKEMEELIEEGFLSAEARDVIDITRIVEFTQSSIGKRMIAAYKCGQLKREQPFVYGLTNEEYCRFANVQEETEKVLLQGIIDAYIDNEDGITLVDYKSDRVKQKGPEELLKRYKVQMELYALALSKITGKPVREKIIYSIDLGMEIVV